MDKVEQINSRVSVEGSRWCNTIWGGGQPAGAQKPYSIINFTPSGQKQYQSRRGNENNHRGSPFKIHLMTDQDNQTDLRCSNLGVVGSDRFRNVWRHWVVGVRGAVEVSTSIANNRARVAERHPKNRQDWRLCSCRLAQPPHPRLQFSPVR